MIRPSPSPPPARRHFFCAPFVPPISEKNICHESLGRWKVRQSGIGRELNARLTGENSSAPRRKWARRSTATARGRPHSRAGVSPQSASLHRRSRPARRRHVRPSTYRRLAAPAPARSPTRLRLGRPPRVVRCPPAPGTWRPRAAARPPALSCPACPRRARRGAPGAAPSAAVARRRRRRRLRPHPGHRLWRARCCSARRWGSWRSPRRGRRSSVTGKPSLRRAARRTWCGLLLIWFWCRSFWFPWGGCCLGPGLGRRVACRRPWCPLSGHARSLVVPAVVLYLVWYVAHLLLLPRQLPRRGRQHHWLLPWQDAKDGGVEQVWLRHTRRDCRPGAVWKSAFCALVWPCCSSHPAAVRGIVCLASFCVSAVFLTRTISFSLLWRCSVCSFACPFLVAAGVCGPVATEQGVMPGYDANQLSDSDVSAVSQFVIDAAGRGWK